MTCPHPTFSASVSVTRLTKVDEGPIIGYTVDIAICCATCGQQFAFLGPKMGSSPVVPTVSADRTELRAPLEPFIPPGVELH